jgi:hypothetical protein
MESSVYKKWNQLAGDAPDGFLIQSQAATNQLCLCLFDLQQSDFSLNVRTAAFAEPIGRQFRVKPTSFRISASNGAGDRRDVAASPPLISSPWSTRPNPGALPSPAPSR